ncbi:MAG: aminotransferase class I/II-fold pyridoxal phosphate-dependent enzyme, partial [Clostridia bacterium]|nr:aminotransferase class I/II-fold pyridoxal phosphate-dependent enzyme [Clostridia bacterium]
MHINTKTIQEGFKPKNGEPRVVPIAQSTTYKYDSSETVGDLFDLKATGHFYTRLSNPTVEAAEIKIAALEGGVGAMCTSSGQSATTLALLNICGSGDHIVSSSAIYGGTFNLFAVTMKKIGIEFTFVSPTATEEELEKAIRPNTKAIFAETLSNPSLDVLNFETYANVAHKNEIPFIVDNTFATPVLCRPFEHGADIIVHSTSKYLDGHAVALGGVIVDSGNFDWTRGKFPEFTRPDESYHGIIYTETFGKSAYIVKARVQMMRDLGNMMSPQNAFLLSLGMETLAIRMERHSENALKVAKWL